MTRKFFAVLILLALGGCGDRSSAVPASTNANVDRLERATEKGPVKLVVRITPAQPRLSDLVEMDVRVTAEPDVEVKPPAFGQAVGDFLVRDYSEKKEVQTRTEPGQPTTHRYRYQLEPVQAGRHLIRSLAIEFIDHRAESESRDKTALIESEPLEVQVTSEFGDKLPNLADLDPMLPPKSIDSAATWTWMLGIVLAALLVCLAFWFRRKRRSPANETVKQTPEEIAHAALNALLAEQLPSRGLVKEFYLRLTGIVRQFIEGTTGLRAPEQTTEEFLRAMRTREIFPADRSARLKEFLEAADMVQYAGQQPDEDQIELSIVRAREFIDLPPATIPAHSLSSQEA